MSEPVIEVLASDIAAFARGNTGVDYVHRFEAGAAGPVVMVNALTHGNELCGAYALMRLFEHDIRPRRGTLILSFANVAAYERFDPDNPGASRFVDEDFNRLWSPEVLDGPRDSHELRRAREYLPFVLESDFLLDIHSMQGASQPVMLCGTAPRGKALAGEVGVPVDIVADAGHRAGARMRDHGEFGAAEGKRTALLVECGQHWLESTVAVANEVTFRFLLATGAIDQADAAPHLGRPPPPQRVIKVSGPVTIESEEFAFVEDYQGLEIIPEAGTVIGHDGAEPVTTPYDECVLIMPSKRLRRGQTAVRFGRIVG